VVKENNAFFERIKGPKKWDKIKMEKNLEKTKVMPRIVPSLKREPKDYNPRL
jgi:hypothetical protein